MARWHAFPATPVFDFDQRSLKRQWSRLHRGDQEPLPQHDALLAAWVLFHNGQFEQAHHQGLGLGPAGHTVANRAACVYAMQLARSEAERLELLQQVSARATEQALREPDNPNAHYLLAYALGRYSQGISVAKALAQGLGSRIKSALETTIRLQPRHAEAHFALGAFHAEIIDKVGALIGGMTYGAKKSTSLQMFAQGFALLPRSPAGLVEYAMALRMLEGEARQDEALALVQQAAALKPADAREYLDIAQAQQGLPH